LFQIAIQTLGYSGSDLKELCKFSSMLPVRRLIRQQRDKDLREQGAGARTAIPEGMLPAPLSNADMEEGLEQVKATGSSATGYRQQFDAAKAKRNGSGGEGGVPVAPNADGSFPPEVIPSTMQPLEHVSYEHARLPIASHTFFYRR
jgi:SpoVK/Ycf46/Vps4 family AAA+-type ATPase